MHTSDQLDLRGVWDRPAADAVRALVRLAVLATKRGIPVEDGAEWLWIDALTADDMREWADDLADVWPDAAVHLRDLARSTDQQMQDPARCADCGADVTRGDLWVVPLRKGGAVTGLCYPCARRVADEQR